MGAIGCPREPRRKAAQVDLAGLQNGKTLADYGHVAFVEVTKWTRCGFSGDTSVNELPRIASLLHRYLRHTGQRLAILIERRSITNHQDLRVAWHCEVLLDPYAPGAIGLCTQPLACWRWSK
jgi:hypothetical protein